MSETFLADLPAWAFAAMLVLCRCGAVVMLMPGWSETDVPATVRAGVALAITLLLLPVLVGGAPPAAPDPAGIVAMVLAETMVGGLIGFLTRLLILALPIAGELISYMLGLANVLQPDPMLGGQSTPVARLFGLLSSVLFMAGGLYAGPLTALSGSYHLFPLGFIAGQGATIHLISDGMTTVAAAVAECLRLALRIAAPFLLLGTIWQVALGLSSRLVPQLQIQSLAMPGQIFGGLAVLGLLAAALLRTWQTAVIAGLAALPGA